MKILHINTLDAGGAANACLRIHQSLKLIGLESKILVLHKSHDNNDIYSFKDFIEKNRTRHFISRLKKLARTSIVEEFYEQYQRLGYFALLDTYYDVLQHPLVKWADVINLHWVGDFIDYPSFFSKVNKPVVWTCHDMNPMTGGCHYFGTCDNYKFDCSQCPLLDKQFNFIASSNFIRKSTLLDNLSGLHFVANSSWVKEALNESKITRKFKHEVIHYPIFLNDFFVINKAQARKQLKIEDKKVILFVAQNLGAKNKGFKYLLEAIRLLNEKYTNLLLFAVGRGSSTDFNDLSNYIHYELINSASSLRTFYNAADVFVIPSVDEAFGQTCLEAMACSVPVVGFKSGGISDMIKDGENGLLVRKKDVKELSEAIGYILDNNAIAERMGEKSLEFVSSNFSPEKQAEKYLAIYRKLLSEKFFSKNKTFAL